MGIVAEVERELAELRRHELADAGPDLRTSVMTHVAWAPPKWAAAARRTLAGLEERHPSRTILPLPEPSKPDGIDVTVSVRCYALPDVSREVCSEVIELRLRGKRSRVPASVVQPLLIFFVLGRPSSSNSTVCSCFGEPRFTSRPMTA